MTRNNWLVGDEGIRPAGDPQHCLYCGEPRGVTHLPSCVIRERTAVVEIKINLVMSFPEYWDAHMIEFHLNESSSCQDNIVDRIDALVRRIQPSCLCNLDVLQATYLREATQEDEEAQKFFVNDLPS